MQPLARSYGVRNTPKSKTAQATCKHFQWLNQVKADRELSPSAFIVAFEIGQHFNRKRGGAAWPSYLTIANAVGLDEATVVRLVRRLRDRGHIKVDPGKRGRGHPNRYFMVVLHACKPRLSAEVKPARAQVSRKLKPASEPLKPAPTQENLLEPLNAPSKEGAVKREREASLRSHPPDVDGALKGAAPSKEKKEDAPKKEIADRRVVVLHPGGDHFNELSAIWRRGWAQDDAPNNRAEAQRAFIEACNHPDPDVRADPIEILEAARSWIAGFPEDPSFLPKLVTWLEARGWETEPPRRRGRDYYRRGKPNTALMMADYARQLELEEARS
jgi:DNA-binding Lrp family transcriptional regulator